MSPRKFRPVELSIRADFLPRLGRRFLLPRVVYCRASLGRKSARIAGSAGRNWRGNIRSYPSMYTYLQALGDWLSRWYRLIRSEERRVGKECRCRAWTAALEKTEIRTEDQVDVTRRNEKLDQEKS